MRINLLFPVLLSYRIETLIFKVKIILYFILTLILLTTPGCGKPRPNIQEITADSVVLAFGDSLTSGVGALKGESYPSILQEKLRCTVINAGVSGQDTQAGLVRLSNELKKHQPSLVILCFGGNDMLRKQPETQTIANLRQMIEIIKNFGANVLLIGVPKPGIVLRVPDFYRELAQAYGLAYDGEVLKKVLSNGTLKSDHIHPNAKGYSMIAEALHTLIKQLEQ